MKIAIIGSGAMGSIVGAWLTNAGADVTLIDTWREHIEAMRNDGLTVSSDEGDLKVKVQAVTQVDPTLRFDLVVILVKALTTVEAARQAQAMLAPGGAVVSFQNGIGNEELIAEVVGIDRTIGGTIYFGGNVVAPGHVRMSLPRGRIVVGPLSAACDGVARSLSELLTRAGFDSRTSDDVLALKWEKALVNMGPNALATILDEPNRVAGDIETARIAMEACCAEAIAVAKAKGIALPGGDDPLAYVRQATDVHSYLHKSSMCIDLSAGRRTEVDVMNGAIERFGREVGLATPINTIVTAAIHRIEREKARSQS